MQRQVKVNFGNFLLSFSEAVDLADPALTQHQQRTAFIAWEMAKKANLPMDRLKNLFIAALLHDIGIFSLKEKLMIRQYEIENLESHCIKGEILLKRVPWLKEAARLVRYHHTKWTEWNESIDSDIVFDSQILYVADLVERKIKRDIYILFQKEDIFSEIRSLSGTVIHDDIVELFFSISQTEEFWLDLFNSRLYSLLLNEGPLKGIEIDFEEITVISELFRHIIDFRSRFTATHSSGVAASALLLARLLGLTEYEMKLLEVAGNLHDIGKLAIPNEILDKPGKLTKEEMELMKSHTYYTYSVIKTIGGLQQIAEWAAYHHEKLDGSGYPFHCKAPELSIGSRIVMVADIFTALTEDRPYRKGLPRVEVEKILKKFSDQELLDRNIIKLLLENYDEVHAFVAEKQKIARQFYESQFAETVSVYN
ncbi:MAG: HD domain-containing protein [Nitrospirae bacterium]|nr:HD domain-containing protein [Nitrospirota bacterium]